MMAYQQSLAQETKERLLAGAQTSRSRAGSPGLCTVCWEAVGAGKFGVLIAAPASKQRESYGSETYTFSALLLSRQMQMEIIITFQAMLQGNL